MGAACSSTVSKKYNDLKNYLNSKECMTFDVIHGYISASERPPVILIGENHTINNSHFGSQSCVTSFAAMNEIVSGCKDPVAKVHFIVEREGSIIAESRSMQSMKDDKQFSLRYVCDKDDRHSRMWSSGLSVVPFDLFSTTRRLFIREENTDLLRNDKGCAFVLAAMTMEMTQVFSRMGMPTEMTSTANMTKLSQEMGGTLFHKLHPVSESGFRMSEHEVRTLLDDCFYRMITEIGQYSEGVYKKIAEIEEKDRQVRLYKTRLMEEDLLANFLEGTDKTPRYSEKEILSHMHVFRPWMIQVVYCIYLFTLAVLEPKMSKVEREVFETRGTTPSLEPDLVFAKRVIELLFEKLLADPNLYTMFMFISRCGDYITYGLYLRDKLTKPNTSSDIYVVYGGSAHTDALSALIQRLPSHKMDLARVSKRVCRDRRTDYGKWWCDNMPNVSAEEYVRML